MALDTTKFLGGDGSAVNPYIIHNEDALLALIGDEHSDGSAQSKYFEVVADIDITYLSIFTLKIASIDGSVINGNGHSLYFPILHSNSGFDCLFIGVNTAEIYNLHIDVEGKSGVSSYGPVRRCKLYNCMLTGNYGDIRGATLDTPPQNLQNCLFNLQGSTLDKLSTSSSYSSVTSYYVEGSAPITSTASEGLVLNADKLLAASYPNLAPEHWNVVDGALPTLKIKPYSGLPVTRVAGISKLDGVPAKRRITVQDFNGGRIARTYSDELTGEFSIQTSPYKTGVTVIVDDEIGTEIQSSKAYTVGQIVHHADYAGIAYVCTTAGTTGATLPETNTYPESGTVTIGTAVFAAKPINKPQIFSPVKPEVILE
ncbi:hypothetical protein DS2_10477 [Catenovulum agarivorans DS-2]|uniref:Uncharacterized protein n=1 Tax=Catenovulum agarivorans DS-2 TaxID=1328313 RepID=W7QX57_9ALTE|nr:hypothetical protein [Catenovulum agarivorans]EWH09865.1 hypothetical protein DS2_10477 [Catenovulum agarivorans DS-2]